MPTTKIGEEENISERINKNNISAVHILLVIILITVDYFSMFNYGIELKSFKYIVDYQELLIINTSIIIIFSLISIITRRAPSLFLLTSTALISINIYYLDELIGVMDSILQTVLVAIIYAVISFTILYGSKDLYKKTIEVLDTFGFFLTKIVCFITSILLTFLIYTHYVSLNNDWNKLYIKKGQYKFDTGSITHRLFNPKIFSTSRLEKLQSNIRFNHSEYYIEQLEKESLLKNNILEYNNKLLFSNYIINKDYKTLFIVKKVNEEEFKNLITTTLYIIFTKKDNDKEEYQIINLLKKELIVEVRSFE